MKFIVMNFVIIDIALLRINLEFYLSKEFESPSFLRVPLPLTAGE